MIETLSVDDLSALAESVDLEWKAGTAFRGLPELERLALVTAVTEGMVNHARLREISTEHPADITKLLAHLVKEGFLVSDGVGRGMVYYVPWATRPHTGDLFSSDPLTKAASKTPALTDKRQELDPKCQELSSKCQELDPKCQELGLPIWSDRSQIPYEKWADLLMVALPVRQRGKVGADAMQTVIMELCRGRFIGLFVLAELLERNEEHLRNRILNVMVSKQLLHRAFPRPNDPRQAYTTNMQTEEETEA